MSSAQVRGTPRIAPASLVRGVRRRTKGAAEQALRLGVDTGGTFTDLTLFSPVTGEIWSLKVPSTADDPSEAILYGTREVAKLAGVPIEKIGYLGHGTTVATNTLIQLKGANCGLITTGGFRDLLEIGRQKRPDLYDLFADKPPVLIPRVRRKEISERVTYEGKIFRPLDLAELDKAVAELQSDGIESLAVCFLYSYLNPDHELKVKEVLQRRHPHVYVYLSSEVLPEFREYERLSTTVLCAYLGPVVGKYSERLTRKVKEAGLGADVYVTQSNGGIMSGSAVKERPIETALSGPASGVIASAYLGKKLGLTHLITLDMGGTSADVSLISDGTPTISTQRTVAGYPVKTPMIDVHTIGAGGGSVAWVDAGGALKVGPTSAGAQPGPACYGRGGMEPTVTDANLVLGRINPDYFLGGRMEIFPELARKAIEAKVCGPLHMTLVRAAVGILAIVNANMIAAIRAVSVQKGYDPREFTLVAFGGAGALHAARVAKELGIRRVLVPSSPGTFSSLGLLVADFRSDFVRTHILRAKVESFSTVVRIFNELDTAALAWLARENVPPSKIVLRRSIEARYLKQNFELPVDLDDRKVGRAELNKTAELFHEAHRKAHGYALDSPIEFVNYRVTARGVVPKAELRAHAKRHTRRPGTRAIVRAVYFEEVSRFVECATYRLEELAPGKQIRGPAIVEQFGSTALIPPDARAAVDALHNITIYTGA